MFWVCKWLSATFRRLSSWPLLAKNHSNSVNSLETIYLFVCSSNTWVIVYLWTLIVYCHWAYMILWDVCDLSSGSINPVHSAFILCLCDMYLCSGIYLVLRTNIFGNFIIMLLDNSRDGFSYLASQVIKSWLKAEHT